MRVAAILGLGCSPHSIDLFRKNTATHWNIGLPPSSDETDAIAIFGGDGTIHRHLAALVKLQLPVMIVPAGSGNDFARALNLHSPRHSLAAWQQFVATGQNLQTTDLGTITPLNNTVGTHLFCCVAGCGLDAEVARRANALPRWMRAHGGYALSVPAALLSYKTPNIKLSIADDLETYVVCRDQPTLLTALANVPAYGDGMKIAPRAKIDDGHLDICFIDQISRTKLLRLFPTVYFGKHLGIPEVHYFQAKRLKLESDRPLDVYADGEYVCQTPIEVGVARAAMRVITP
jgi:diacylglycerol kinase family enzyme